MPVLWEIAALLFAVPVIAVLHEAGHALMARPAGFRVTSFGVGRGKALLRHRTRKGTVLWIGRWFLAGGSCVAIPRGLGSGYGAALYHAGGLIAQALLALGLSALPGWWWIGPVARFNLLVLVWNLLPWRVAGVASDGWWLQAVLWRGGAGKRNVLGRRRVVRRLLRHEEQADSPVGVFWCRLLLAWTDLLVGRLEAADLFFEDGPPRLDLSPDLEALYGDVEAEWHRLRRRPLGALGVLRKVHERLGSALSLEAEDLLALTEARVWLQLSEPARARAALARLAGTTGVPANEALVVRLEIALRAGDANEVETGARRLEQRLRGGFLDPPAAVKALWEAAVVMGADGRLLMRERFAHRARLEAARLLAAVDPADRAPLARRLGESAGLRSAPTRGDQPRITR